MALSPARSGLCDQDRALLSRLRGPLIAALLRARRRQRAGQAARRPGLWRACDLTGREIEIPRLAASGRTNIAIAHQLDVSPRTIAKHLEHVYRKLGVSSRAAAVPAWRWPALRTPKDVTGSRAPERQYRQPRAVGLPLTTLANMTCSTRIALAGEIRPLLPAPTPRIIRSMTSRPGDITDLAAAAARGRLSADHCMGRARIREI